MEATPVVPTVKKYTNLKLTRDTHRRAKAVATLVGEEFYQFVETSITDRITSLQKAGKVIL